MPRQAGHRPRPAPRLARHARRRPVRSGAALWCWQPGAIHTRTNPNVVRYRLPGAGIPEPIDEDCFIGGCYRDNRWALTASLPTRRRGVLPYDTLVLATVPSTWTPNLSKVCGVPTAMGFDSDVYAALEPALAANERTTTRRARRAASPLDGLIRQPPGVRHRRPRASYGARRRRPLSPRRSCPRWRCGCAPARGLPAAATAPRRPRYQERPQILVTHGDVRLALRLRAGVPMPRAPSPRSDGRFLRAQFSAVARLFHRLSARQMVAHEVPGLVPRQPPGLPPRLVRVIPDCALPATEI